MSRGLCEWLSRYRFSWVELLGITSAGTLLLDGHFVLWILPIVVFSVAQAFLAGRAE